MFLSATPLNPCSVFSPTSCPLNLPSVSGFRLSVLLLALLNVSGASRAMTCASSAFGRSSIRPAPRVRPARRRRRGALPRCSRAVPPVRESAGRVRASPGRVPGSRSHLLYQPVAAEGAALGVRGLRGDARWRAASALMTAPSRSLSGVSAGSDPAPCPRVGLRVPSLAFRCSAARGAFRPWVLGLGRRGRWSAGGSARRRHHAPRPRCRSAGSHGGGLAPLFATVASSVWTLRALPPPPRLGPSPAWR